MPCRTRLQICILLSLLLLGHGLWALPSKRSIESGWQFRRIGEKHWNAAQVPGTVHSDLYMAGIIPDPYFGKHEAELQWIEREEWEYRAPLEVSPAEARASRKVLVLHGLDTYADVYVNDSLLLQAHNMFRRWEIDVSRLLKGKADSLRIVFHSPLRKTAKEAAQRGYRLPADNDSTGQSIYARKAAYHFGWDWAPRFVTAGIWRPIELMTWEQARIRDFYPATIAISPQRATMQADISLDIAQLGNYQITVSVDGAPVVTQTEILEAGRQHLKLPFDIMNPQLWWPAGAGKAHLYNISLRIAQQERVIDEVVQPAGVRTIALEQTPDAVGTGFRFVVNGRPIFMKGTNYVPGDVFLPRARHNRSQLLSAMQAVNMNMVRVWGGGVYEDDAFYDECDRLGILVWQDFMFSGGMYPADDHAFLANVEAEIKGEIQRLRRHPSIALWCGNNEIEVAWFNWGWQKKYGITPQDSVKLWESYQNLFTEKIPAWVNESQPGHPYIASSPLSNWGHPDRYLRGNMHDWSVWHGNAPIDSLRLRAPRFATEFGFQSYPAFSTLEPYTLKEDRDMDSEWMRSRQKSYKGNAPILTEMERIYGQPRDFSAFLVLSQYVQAQALKAAIETHRVNRPHCMGTLYWQLNDCWPGPSWSTIDYLGRWKAGHFALKRLFAPVLVVVSEEQSDIVVRVASDMPTGKEATLQLRLKTFTGSIVGQQDKVITLPADSAAEVFRMPISSFGSRFDRRSAVLEAMVHAGGQTLATDAYYFVALAAMKLPDPEFKYGLQQIGDHYLLSIESTHLLKDVEIRVQGAEASFSDNFLDCLPGRKYEIEIRNVDAQSPEDLLARLRFRDLTRLLK